MAFFTDDISINTIIGAGSAIAGDIRVNGIVRIEGDIDGNIEATGNIFVGEKARIRGNITAASAEICGIIIGDVVAPKGIRLLSSAAVIGDIFTKRIEIEDRVILHGHCIAIKDEGEYELSAKQFTEEKVIRNKVV